MLLRGSAESQAAAGLVLQQHRLPGHPQQPLPRGSGGDGDRASQQNVADLALQGLDALGEGRAGDLQQVGGCIEGPLVHRQHEGSQLIGIHRSTLEPEA